MQMLELKVDGPRPHVKDAEWASLSERRIRTNQHCFGCTAGCGSSCSGFLVPPPN